MQGKTWLSRRCAKVCRAPEKGKSHEESYDSSWDFGALEGTRIPGPLIKSQMLYRLSYERIFCGKTIPPNNITTIGCKKQEQRSKKRKIDKSTNNFNKNSPKFLCILAQHKQAVKFSTLAACTNCSVSPLPMLSLFLSGFRPALLCCGVLSSLMPSAQVLAGTL